MTGRGRLRHLDALLHHLTGRNLIARLERVTLCLLFGHPAPAAASGEERCAVCYANWRAA